MEVPGERRSSVQIEPIYLWEVNMTNETPTLDNAVYTNIIERVWTDPEFGAKLKADPRLALSEYKIEIPAEMNIVIVQDTDKVCHLVIPSSPTNARSADTVVEQLIDVSDVMTIVPSTGSWT